MILRVNNESLINLEEAAKDREVWNLGNQALNKKNNQNTTDQSL